MSQISRKGSLQPSPSLQNQKLSAKIRKPTPNRICQADIFCNLRVTEDVAIDRSNIILKEISFPYLVCLSQECDLERDYEEQEKDISVPTTKNLMHIAFAPAFIFDDFLTGDHWGDLYSKSASGKRKDTNIKAIIDNEASRYHYLNFSRDDQLDRKKMPELIIDFKHYYTINKNIIYRNMDKRLCSIDDLFREKISQRFSYFQSRIGLPA